MNEFLHALPNTFIPIFVAMDPFIIVPVFVSLTEGISAKSRDHVVNTSAVTALTVSLIFTMGGSALFRVMGITVFDFKVAGGLVLLVIAILDLVSTGAKAATRNSEHAGVVPIGVPLIVGPAVLTTIIVLMDNQGLVLTVTSLVLNILIVWIAMKSAKAIVRFMGINSMKAISKIMAIMLASLAVMMIRLGIAGMTGH